MNFNIMKTVIQITIRTGKHFAILMSLLITERIIDQSNVTGIWKYVFWCPWLAIFLVGIVIIYCVIKIISITSWIITKELIKFRFKDCKINFISLFKNKYPLIIHEILLLNLVLIPNFVTFSYMFLAIHGEIHRNKGKLFEIQEKEIFLLYKYIFPLISLSISIGSMIILKKRFIELSYFTFFRMGPQHY